MAVTLPPPYDRRCDECESIGGHASHCSKANRDDELEPVLAYESAEGDWVVSKGWMWFPGIYADRDAAELAAATFDDADIELLWGTLPDPRPITVEDLRGVED